MATHLDITLAGETLRLLPERAILWPRTGALIVADVHWGKAAAFRAASIAIPPGTTTTDVDRLSALLHMSGARELIILGDLFHARAGMTAETLATLRAWRERHTDVSMLLVRGNHDRHAGDPPPDLAIDCFDAPHSRGPFSLCHHPCERDLFVVAGHVHPGVRLTGRGAQKLTLPCFAIGERHMIVPSFGTFTGLGVIDPADFERLIAVADNEVIEVRRGVRPPVHCRTGDL